MRITLLLLAILAGMSLASLDNAPSSLGEYRLLLIVGDVGANSARILYEALPPPDHGCTLPAVMEELALSVKVFEEPQHQLAQTLAIKATNRAKVLRLGDLKEQQEYRVEFGEEGFDVASFRTFSSGPSGKKNLKFLVVGCNRYYEDGDSEMWRQLLVQNPERDGMIHTGDQIYADSVAKNLTLPSGENKTYEQLLEDYRHIYRTTFGEDTMQQILRRGPHWMIPDDHDFINNFGPDIGIKPDSNLTRASVRAFDEYQLQLIQDIDELHEAKVEKRIDFVKRIGPNMAFVLLDLRLYRTLHFDPEHPMVGTRPLLDFKQRIKELGEDKNVDHIFVLSGVPLFFFTEFMSKIAFWVEKECNPTHPNFQKDTFELMDIMKPYSSKIRLVSGDLHQFVQADYCHTDGSCLPQLLSSGMTNGSAVMSEWKLVLFYLFGRQYTEPETPLEGWRTVIHQQVLYRNYGVLEASLQDGTYRWHGVFPIDIPKLMVCYQFVYDWWYIIINIIAGIFSFVFLYCCCKCNNLI